VRTSSEDDVLTVADLGSMDGEYSKWLNDTGVFRAFAFEGANNVGQITDGFVTETDLTSERLFVMGNYSDDAEPELPHWIRQQIPFDLVLCLEVAEHIPPEKTHIFLKNIDAFAGQGMVISWAPPHILGEGHVNTKSAVESRGLIETTLGFTIDEEITAKLRANAQLSWIGESVAFYRRNTSSRDT